MARATSENEQCQSVALKIFSDKHASQPLKFSTGDPHSLDALKYFGDLIQSSKFSFDGGDYCDADKTSKYRQLFQYANQYKESVEDFEIMGEICGLNLFDEIKDPLNKTEIVVINQRNMHIDKGNKNNLCKIFPNVQILNLNVENLNKRTFIDCEFHLLDKLIIGGAILDETYHETFKNFLIKNSRIQHITFTSPTNRRIFLLLKKYLRNLKYVGIFDEVLDDDVENEIFIPSVRKLEIGYRPRYPSHKYDIPMGITFGGEELEELNIKFFPQDRDYKYFSILYRYPNIKVLNAGFKLFNRDLLKMVGRFPLLTNANFEIKDDVTNNTIVKFIEKCDQLKEVNFFFESKELQSWTRNYLKERFSEKFTIPHAYEFGLVRLERNNSNVKFVTSGLLSFFIVIHICHAFLF